MSRLHCSIAWVKGNRAYLHCRYYCFSEDVSDPNGPKSYQVSRGRPLSLPPPPLSLLIPTHPSLLLHTSSLRVRTFRAWRRSSYLPQSSCARFGSCVKSVGRQSGGGRARKKEKKVPVSFVSYTVARIVADSLCTNGIPPPPL